MVDEFLVLLKDLYARTFSPIGSVCNFTFLDGACSLIPVFPH